MHTAGVVVASVRVCTEAINADKRPTMGGEWEGGRELCKESNEMQMNNFEFEYKRRSRTEAAAGEMIWTLLCASCQCCNCIYNPFFSFSFFLLRDAAAEKKRLNCIRNAYNFFVFSYFHFHLSGADNGTAREARKKTEKCVQVQQAGERRSRSPRTHTMPDTRQVQLTLYFRFAVVFAVHK